jgi:hypothetical protein
MLCGPSADQHHCTTGSSGRVRSRPPWALRFSATRPVAAIIIASCLMAEPTDNHNNRAWVLDRLLVVADAVQAAQREVGASSDLTCLTGRSLARA